MSYKTPILVPRWSKDGSKAIGYSVYIVDVAELSAFLPADSAKSTDNFYAAQTFVEGFAAAQRLQNEH